MEINLHNFTKFHARSNSIPQPIKNSQTQNKLPLLNNYKKKTRLILRKHITLADGSIPNVKLSLSDKKSGNSETIELTPDRWSLYGFKYRTNDIRKAKYFNSPNKVNFHGETSYQFLSHTNNITPNNQKVFFYREN